MPPDCSPYCSPIDDHDGDGRPDLVALVYVGGTPQLWIVRGTNGAQLAVLATNAGNTGPLRNLGDIDRDGRPEVAFLNSASGVQIYRLTPPGLVRTLPRPAGTGPLRSLEAADLTGDGVREALVADDWRELAAMSELRVIRGS